MSDRSRLRWRCRRGIREMDLLLERFLNECYPALPEADRVAFEKLLDEPDLDIFSWTTGRTECTDDTYRTCIMQLRRLHAPPRA